MNLIAGTGAFATKTVTVHVGAEVEFGDISNGCRLFSKSIRDTTFYLIDILTPFLCVHSCMSIIFIAVTFINIQYTNVLADVCLVRSGIVSALV